MPISNRLRTAWLLVALGAAASAQAQSPPVALPKEASEERLRVAMPGPGAMPAKAAPNSKADAAIAEAQRLCSKEFRPAAAMAHLDKELAAAEGEQRGKILSAKGYIQIAAEDLLGAEATFAKIGRGEEPASEHDYADARRRVAYLKLKRGDKESALKDFLQISTGMVKASPHVTADAARRAAAILRIQRRPFEAMELWSQVAEKSPHVQERLDSQLQLAGLLWEIGKSDYEQISTKEQADQYFKLSMDVARSVFEHSEVRPETKATAELIHLEGYYFQGEFQSALDQADAYIAHWEKWWRESPEAKLGEWRPARQLITAYTWKCFCEYRTGKYAESIKAAQIVRQDRWKPEDPYPNFPVVAYSLVYEAMANEKLGNDQEGARLRQDCSSRFPAWYDTMITHVENKVSFRRSR